MTNELLIAALHQQLSDSVLRKLLLSGTLLPEASISSVLDCVRPLVSSEKYQHLLELYIESTVASLEEMFKQKGVRVFLSTSPEYPLALKGSKRPPPVLYVQGDPSVLDSNGIGICGSRNSSPKGLKFARQFGSQVARLGSSEVSGYAKGVDTEAHLGAIEAGGSTVVVLAEGILNFSLKRTFNGINDV